MTGLPKQVQSFPFVQGPDTKSDPKLAQKPSRLENAVFRGGSVQKRWGRTQLPTATFGGGNQNKGRALFAFNDDLIRINNAMTYAFAAQGGVWVAAQGGGPSVALTETSVVRNSSTQRGPDQATAGGITVTSWVDTDGASRGVHVRVADSITGAVYQDGATAFGGGVTALPPRCIGLGDSVVLVWTDSTNSNVYSAYVAAASPAAAPTAATIRTNCFSGLDGIAYSGGIGVVAYQSGVTGADITFFAITTTGTVAASPALTVASAVITGGAITSLLLQRDTQGNLYAVYQDAAGLDYLVRGPTFASVLGKTTFANTTAWNGAFGFDTAASYEVTANQITVVLAPNSTGRRQLAKVTLTSAGVGTAFATLPGTVGLRIVTDVAVVANVPVFGVVNVDNSNLSGVVANGIQCTAWLVNLSGEVVARALEEQSSVSGTVRTARPITSDGATSFLFSQQGRAAFASLSGTVFEITPVGITSISARAVFAGTLPSLRLGQTQYLGGGQPNVFDGTIVTPDGFPLYPTMSTVTMSGAGGFLSAGTYQYRLLYSFINNQGELTRGIPCPATSAVAVADNSAAFNVMPMPLSGWDILTGGPFVVIEVYRTTANGTIFYRQSSVTVPTLNTTGYNLIAFTDTTPDADLQTGELLYTTGGILDWEAPPAYSVACVHKQRLIVAVGPYEWWPSSQWVNGETVRFSSFTSARIPASTGPITGLAGMDGKLIIFTSQTAYLVIGDGPDQLGNNPYPPPERIISVDSGPLPGTPIVETPLGLMYQSTNGISLLDRGLNAQLIGADVVQFSTGLWTLRSAFLDSSAQQVRFLLDTGRDVPGAQMGTLAPSLGGVSLVYDYFYSQWSVFPNYGGQASCEYQGQYTMVRSDGVCWQEVPGTFLDQGAAYTSLVETPWIKQAGLQGFQRLWYATLLGTFGSACTINWDTAFSYSTSSPAVPVYETANSTSLDGSGVFDIGGALEFRHFIGAKCSAVKFRFYDSGISGSGQGMGLSDLSIEWGVRKGVFKLPAIQTA